MSDQPPKPENQLRGNAYIHKADPGQTVTFASTGSQYLVTESGALRRVQPKLNKKQRRAARKLEA